MDMSSLRQSSVFSPAQDASASISQLELGRPRASQIPESFDGAEESFGPRQVDHADGVVETDRQHGRIRESPGRKHDVLGSRRGAIAKER